MGKPVLSAAWPETLTAPGTAHRVHDMCPLTNDATAGRTSGTETLFCSVWMRTWAVSVTPSHLLRPLCSSCGTRLLPLQFQIVSWQPLADCKSLECTQPNVQPQCQTTTLLFTSGYSCFPPFSFFVLSLLVAGCSFIFKIHTLECINCVNTYISHIN